MGAMHVDGDQMWILLRSLDDPHNLEFPVGYHHVETRRRFDELVRQLEALLRLPLNIRAEHGSELPWLRECSRCPW
jgi:hypothetical protein